MQNSATEKKNRLNTIIKAENQFMFMIIKIPARKSYRKDSRPADSLNPKISLLVTELT